MNTGLEIIGILLGELIIIRLGIRLYFKEKLRYQTDLLNFELKKNNQNEKEN